MAFKLEKRTYTTLDLLRIPFRCSPVRTVLVCVQKLMTAFTNVFQVVAIAEVVDRTLTYVRDGSGFSSLMGWFVLMLALVGWKRVSYNIGRLLSSHVFIQANEQLSVAFAEKRAKLRYGLIEDEETGKLADRVSTNIERNVWEMLQRFTNFFLIYIPRIIGMFVIIMTQNWWLGLVMGVLVVPLIFLSLRGGKKIYKADQEAAAQERRHKYLFEVLTGREAAEERSLFRYTEKVNSDWHARFEDARKINLKAETIFETSIQGGSAITSLISSAIVLIMVPSAASGVISIGMFIALATAVYDLVNLMGWEMTRAVSQIAKFRELMRDYTAFAALPETDGATELPELPLPFESLELRGVTFKYPGTDRYILKDFSMKLEPGRHYAFVGENGAGKTTVTKLLTGLYREYEGDILLNGKDLREYSEPEIKAMFSGVFQDFARYYVSVRDNILLGDARNMETAEAEERMTAYARRLDLHDTVSALPNGYDTRIGKLDDGSVDLSGGQWQRVAMARALMNPAPVQILDEPTAALDPISESRLYEQFEEISRGRTTIFISHRLGSTKLADHIFVLRDGTVSEQGSHEQLMAEDGLYAAMYKSQQSWYATKEATA